MNRNKRSSSWTAARTLGLQGKSQSQFSSEEITLSTHVSEEASAQQSAGCTQRAATLGQHLLASPIYTGVMLVLTVFALFGEDLRVLTFPASADNGFNGVASFTFFAFVFDLLLASFSRTSLAIKDSTTASGNALQEKFGIKGYFLSFFFWLDFVAALSIITEIPWIWSLIVGKSQVSVAPCCHQCIRVRRGRLHTRQQPNSCTCWARYTCWVPPWPNHSHGAPGSPCQAVLPAGGGTSRQQRSKLAADQHCAIPHIFGIGCDKYSWTRAGY